MRMRASLRRFAHIAAVLARHALAHALGSALARWPRAARALNASRAPGPERLRALLEDIGGTFIKFGQMLALQPDILSFSYCNALFNLLDRVAPFDYAHVSRTFREELGREPEEMFDGFDRRPLATASIGQVHVAQLGARKLAIKIRRPGVEAEFLGDTRLMSAALALIRHLRLRPVYWLIEPMGEFISWTQEELDFRNEARYMERLRRNAEGNACECVPAVFAPATTRRTLASEFLEGMTVLAYLRAKEAGDHATLERLDAEGFDPDRVARNIIDNFLGDVFRHGMFHADLHPANLMLMPGNAVGYVDFGITGTISRYSRQNLISLTLAYTRGDLEGMCESFFRVSAMDSGSNPEGFRAGLMKLADGWYSAGGRERRLRKNFTLVMLDMLRLSRRTGIWPQRDVVKYIRSAIAIDGLITRFAPGFDVGCYLETVCASHLKRQIRTEVFSYEKMAGWAGAGTHMLRDGAFRAQTLVKTLAAGELPARAETTDARDGALRQRGLYLAAAVFTFSAVASAGGEASWGVNLFTAEVAFAAVAAAMLLRTVLRLTGDAREPADGRS